MDSAPRTRTIDVLLYEDVNAVDVSGPAQAFHHARLGGRRIYGLRYVSMDGAPVRASCGLVLAPDGRLSAADDADDLLVPGGAGVDRIMRDEAILDAVRARAARPGDGRLLSVCSGALVLAAAGALDGHAATTHWSRERDTKRFPTVAWDLDHICVTSDRVLTSAGVTTGIDLALAVIRSDCGHAVALAVARELVVQLRRTGGQSQYAMHLAGQFAQAGLGRLIEAVIAEPKRAWTLDALAGEAGMNRRTLSRAFQRHLAMPPARFVERARVDHARGLLQDGLPLKAVATESGFGDLQRMRRAFQRRYGVSVAQYAAAFGEGG